MSASQPGSGWSQPGEPVDPNDADSPPPGYPSYPSSPAHPPYPQPPPYQPYAYPPVPSARPSNITAASVLAYIDAGLLLVAAMLLFLGASVVSSLRATVTADRFGTELALDGVFDVVLAALLITGGVLLGNRQVTGRTLITVSAALSAADAIYWAARLSSGGVGFYVVLFVSLPTIAAGLAWSPSASQWLATAAPS